MHFYFIKLPFLRVGVGRDGVGIPVPLWGGVHGKLLLPIEFGGWDETSA